MRKFVCLLVCLFVGLTFSVILFGGSTAAEDIGLEELRLYVGRIEVIPAEIPKRIVIGNPEVLEVEAAKRKEIVILPKSPGTTTFVFWDRMGEHSFQVKVLAGDLELVKKRVDNLLKELGLFYVSTKINEDEAKVFIFGKVKTEQERKNLELVLKPLADKVINLVTVREDKPLVKIDVEVLEIQKTSTRELGVEWPQSLDISSASVTDTGSKIFRISDLTRSELKTVINLLITEGKARDLARPKLVALSGKEAETLVGGEIPVLTATGMGGITVEYKTYGVKLKIKPEVVEGDRIQTHIEAEVSDVDWANAVMATVSGVTGMTSYETPAFKTRTASTEVFLKEDQTLIMSGLLRDEEVAAVQKFPGLSQIPILGALFRSKRFERGETELVITLSPSILREEGGQQIVRVPQDLSSSYARLPSELRDYIYSIQKKISAEAIKYLPRGVSGTVKLSLHILRTGMLEDAIIVESSGIGALDEAALNSVKRLSPYPAFPAYAEQEDIWVDLPIIYKPR